MNPNKTASLLAMTLLAAALMPIGAADMTNYDDEKFATGPVGVLPQEPTGAAVAACLEDEDFGGTPPPVLSCEPNAGTLQSAGGVFFDVPAGNTYGREVEVNVKRIDGIEGGGFRIDGCSDVDDDSSSDYCTTGYAGNGQDCAKEIDKDKKDCEDPTDAGFVGCAFRDYDRDVLGNLDGTFDDYVVFITAWADTTAINENNPVQVVVPDPTNPGDLITVTVFPEGDGMDKRIKEKDHVAASAGTFRVRVDWKLELDLTDCFYEALGLNGAGSAVTGAPAVFDDWDADQLAMPSRTCSDDINNDADGGVDWNGGWAGGIPPRTPADTECDHYWQNTE